EPFSGGAEAEEPEPRQTIVVEVGGRRLEVSLPAEFAAASAAAPAKAKPRKRTAGKKAAAPSGDAVTAPMQGTLVKVAVSEGDQVKAGDMVAVLEAMKMENPVNAHKDGTVTGLTVKQGDSVSQGRSEEHTSE